jgi:hypothetical protein
MQVEIVSAPPNAVISDNIIRWVPDSQQIGMNDFYLAAHFPDARTVTFHRYVMVAAPASSGCAFYTKKESLPPGNPALLSAGYIAFDNDSMSGLYVSPIAPFRQRMVPNTLYDIPRTINISDDGRWILYYNLADNGIYLIRPNGRGKTKVPLADPEVVFHPAGFLRSSPYGTEIFYLAGMFRMQAVAVTLSDDTARFGVDRVLADFSSNLRFCFDPNPYAGIAVAKDQIIARINPMLGTAPMCRTNYLTIPDSGRGVGHSEDVYRWSGDTITDFGGCGHAMSFDGKYAIANAAYGVGGECVPHNHHGFYLTDFRRKTCPPIGFKSDHTDRYAKSLNWGPASYQDFNSYENFTIFNFTNDNRYITTSYLGKTKPASLWMVNWVSNEWIPLTPVEQSVRGWNCAGYFGPAVMPDTNQSAPQPIPISTLIGDLENPMYRVISPNGGETYHIGDTCLIKFTARKHGQIKLMISVDGGKMISLLPGVIAAIDPFQTPEFRFVIPESIDDASAVSDKCLIVIRDYTQSKYEDQSDGFFSIVP